MTWQFIKKINNICVPGIDQSSSLFCIFSSFVFNISIVHHFDTVKHLDMVESGHICGHQAHVRVHKPPHSQDCEKAGNEAMHPWTAGHETIPFDELCGVLVS